MPPISSMSASSGRSRASISCWRRSPPSAPSIRRRRSCRLRPDEADFKGWRRSSASRGWCFARISAGENRLCPRPLRGGAVAGRILSLCGARGGCRANAADRDRSRGGSGDRGRHRHSLIRPGDIGALAQQMRAFLAHPKPFLGRAIQLQKHVAKRLTVERMTREILDFYISALGDVPAGEACSSKISLLRRCPHLTPEVGGSIAPAQSQIRAVLNAFELITSGRA